MNFDEAIQKLAETAYNKHASRSGVLKAWEQASDEIKLIWSNHAIDVVEALNTSDDVKDTLLTADPAVQRHPLSQRFHDILRELAELHDRKQHDYGQKGDPFHNIRSSASDWGVKPWVAAMIRGDDKDKRLQNMAKGVDLKNEGAADSFSDGACYRIIAQVMWEADQKPIDPATSNDPWTREPYEGTP